MKSFFRMIFAFLLAFMIFSCQRVSIDEILNSYNETFSPGYGDEVIASLIKAPALIPEEEYSANQPSEIKIQANKGYIHYVWTFADSTGKKYDVNTGMSVLYINTASFEKGEYNLTLNAEDVLGGKYFDTAIVNIN